MKVRLFILITLLLLPHSFVQANPAEQQILQQYELLSHRITSKSPLTKEFSLEEQWTLAQAFFLLRNFPLTKDLLTNLTRTNSPYRSQALALQLKIAILTQDTQLNRLITSAKQANLPNSEELTLANATQWLASQAPKNSINWQQIAHQSPILEAQIQKTPPYTSQRVRMERQLINLYSQQKDTSSLEQLLEKVSLAEDRQLISLNLGILQAKNLDQASHWWQQATTGPLVAHQEHAYFLLLLVAIHQQQWEHASNWLISLQRLLPTSDVRLQILSLYQDFTNQEQRKVTTALNRLLGHRSFSSLPKTLQRQLYAMRATTRLQSGDRSGAKNDFQWLTSQDPTSFSWRFTYAVLSQNFNNPEVVSHLHQQAITPIDQQQAVIFEAYHLYTTYQHVALHQLLQEYHTVGQDQPLFWIYLATLQQFEHNAHQAARSFAKAAELLENRVNLQALAFMHSATNHAAAQEMPQANYQLSKLLSLDIEYLNNLDVKFLLAQTLANQQQFLKASDLFEQSYQLRLKPDRQIPTLSSLPSYYEISLNYYQSLQKLSDERALLFLEQVAKHNATIAGRIQQQHAQDLFNQEQYLPAAQLLERNYYQLTTSESQQADLLYQSALAYDLAQQTSKAKELFMRHIISYPTSSRTLLVARRLSSLMTYNELNQLLFSSKQPTTTELSTVHIANEAHPIFAIAWVQKHPRRQQAIQWLSQADFSKAPAQEQLAKVKLLAEFYNETKNYELALVYWLEVSDLSLDIEEVQQARLARSVIFESRQDFPAAVNELVQLAHTLTPWQDRSLSALKLAYDLCVRHSLEEPARLLRERMRKEFDWQA